MARSNQEPKVLLTVTDRWVPTARLAIALAKAGFQVEAVCPSQHPLALVSVVPTPHPYSGLAPLKSISRAIAAAEPDLLVSGDDLATRHLHDLQQRQAQGSPLYALIARSLGRPESFSLVFERSHFIQRAIEKGVRAPTTKVIRTIEELHSWIAHAGLPTVLKANGTNGGDGVKVIGSTEEATAAFRALHAPPLLARALKRALIDRDSTLVRPSLLRQHPVVNAQAFITGQEATSAVACWNGEVLASLQFEVLQKVDSSGPATVLRQIENRDMSHAAETMVRELSLSGLHGFDFMLEPHTGNAYLIEINPRATQTGHLTFGAGRDLPAALYAAATGRSLRPAPRITENDVIALFPKEWLRDPESPLIRSGYHDVPWGEPKLIEFCVRKKHQLWAAQQAAANPAQPSSVSR